jgi:hypothetical protein
LALTAVLRAPESAPDGYRLEPGEAASAGRFVSTRWHGTWFLSFRIEELGGESLLVVVGDYASRFPGYPLAGWLQRREGKRIDTAFSGLKPGSGEQGTSAGGT